MSVVEVCGRILPSLITSRLRTRLHSLFQVGLPVAIFFILSDDKIKKDFHCKYEVFIDPKNKNK